MKNSTGALESRNRGFTMLELLVAVAVTAILATMLLTITRQVVVTHGQTSGNLETNQIANFVLDRIQEDLHCALYRNDGGAWMAATISEDTSTSGSWKTAPAQNQLTNPFGSFLMIGMMAPPMVIRMRKNNYICKIVASV